MTDRHPSTGFRYLHVIPDRPSYREIFDSYKAAAQSMGWMEVLSVEQWTTAKDDLAGDPALAVILWGHTALLEPVRHAGILAGFYTEMIGSPEDFGAPKPNQAGILEKFSRNHENFDLLFAATPLGQRKLQDLCPGRRVFLSPSGYNPDIMGRPSWDAIKNIDLAYYGATTNRRGEILPALRHHLGHPVSDISGSFGSARHSLLNLARAVIHISSWPRATCSTSRIWQSIATSAAMILETTDAWPAVPGRHYLEVPVIHSGNLEEVACMIDRALEDSHRLLALARTAHEELSGYTPECIMDRYIIPAIQEGGSCV